jgi:hypothetical protein
MVRTFAHVGLRRLLGHGLVTTLPVAAMAAVGALALPQSDAHAESGRRICEYSFKTTPRSSPDQLTNISLGLDYKKDGECPTLDANTLAATKLVDVDQVIPDPVPKWTCEDWGRTHQTHRTDLGADPCPKMEDDHVYAFFWMDPTYDGAKPPSYQDLGPDSGFQ